MEDLGMLLEEFISELTEIRDRKGSLERLNSLASSLKQFYTKEQFADKSNITREKNLATRFYWAVNGHTSEIYGRVHEYPAHEPTARESRGMDLAIKSAVKRYIKYLDM